MINVSCSVKNYVEDGINVVVRSAQRQKDRDYYIDVIQIEVDGKICLVDTVDIQDAIDKCSNRRGRRGSAYRQYVPIRDNPNWEERDEE